MIKKILSQDIFVEQTADYIHLNFSISHQMISSAVLNGGLVTADHIVNLRVNTDFKPGENLSDPPDKVLSEFSKSMNWEGVTVGLMTAASMDSFRIIEKSEQGVNIYILVTSGLSNARRAGDRAEHRSMGIDKVKMGTINIIGITSAILLPAAMIEALVIITEAKAAAMQQLKIKSPVSGEIATGTGTDGIVFVNGQKGPTIKYCGKHTLFGEILARAVIEALTASINLKSPKPVNSVE